MTVTDHDTHDDLVEFLDDREQQNAAYYAAILRSLDKASAVLPKPLSESLMRIINNVK